MKIRVRASFSIYMLILLGFSGIYRCIGLIVALVIHESGHAVVARLLGEPIERIELAPFGGVMYYKTGYTSSKGVKGAFLALSGPTANYFTLLLIDKVNGVLSTGMYDGVVAANISMLCLNMIPALPFDGGSVLFSLGYYVFPISQLIVFLNALGLATGGALCLLACMGAIQFGKLNISLIIVGLYVLFYAKQSKAEFLTQNMFGLLCEHMEKPNKTSKVVCYWTFSEASLYSLIPYFLQGHASVFMLETEDGTIAIISEKQLGKAILDAPLSTVGSMLKKQEKNEEKAFSHLKHSADCDRIESFELHH